MFFLEQQAKVYEIKYLTILQVLSEVGGLFNIVLAFLFVVGWYSESLS